MKVLKLYLLSLGLLSINQSCVDKSDSLDIPKHKSDVVDSNKPSNPQVSQNHDQSSKMAKTLGIQSFETAQPPAWLSFDESSKLSLSQTYVQHGKNSLLWSAGKEAYLQFSPSSLGVTQPDDIQELRFWLYCEDPGGKLQIQLGEKSELDKQDG